MTIKPTTDNEMILKELKRCKYRYTLQEMSTNACTTGLKLVV